MRFKIDNEYSTENVSEQKYLRENYNIHHDFVKVVHDERRNADVTVYKFKKTPLLFTALLNYYTSM